MFIERNLTIAGAIKSGTHLRKLAKIDQVGDKGMVSVLIFLLLRIQEYFNVKNELSDSQCSMLAFDILDKYGTETIEDIVIMLKKARQGDFGTSFNKIDSETIFSSWMPKYFELKAIEREKLHREQKSKANTLKKVDEKGIEIWNSVKKSLNDKKVEPKKNILTEKYFVDQFKKSIEKANTNQLRDRLSELEVDFVNNETFINLLKDEITRREK